MSDKQQAVTEIYDALSVCEVVAIALDGGNDRLAALSSTSLRLAIERISKAAEALERAA